MTPNSLIILSIIIFSCSTSFSQKIEGEIIKRPSFDKFLRLEGTPQYALVGSLEQSVRVATIEGYNNYVPSTTQPEPSQKPGAYGSYSVWMDLFKINKVYIGDVEEGAIFPIFYRVYTKLPVNEKSLEIDRFYIEEVDLKIDKNVNIFVYINPTPPSEDWVRTELKNIRYETYFFRPENFTESEITKLTDLEKKRRSENKKIKGDPLGK